ncbi:MAG: YcxB family protein [Elusimicrobia bacterium]|nr:YcxB family protein [Elusimicrobiota bacterium]
MEQRTDMEVDYQNNLGDFISFNFYACLRNRVLQLIMIITALTLLQSNYAWKQPLGVRAYSFLLGMGLFAGLFSALLVLIVLVNYKRPQNRIAFSNHKLKLSRDGVSEVSEYSNMSCSWKAVNKIVQNNRLFMIYFSNNLAFLVPKRIFETEEQLRSFLDCAASLWKGHSASAPERVNEK